MSGLGDFLPKSISDLPKLGDTVSNFANEATDFVSKSIADFSVADATKKISEGAVKILESAGNISGFKSITKGLPTSVLSKAGVSSKQQSMTDRRESSKARDNNEDVIVKLVSTVDGKTVIFEASPRLGESRQANYTEVNLVQHPGSILKYDRTSSRGWQLSCRLISRTPSEASKNQIYLNIIRSWVMPYYGEGVKRTSPNLLGAPPPILNLSGYGAKNISPIPTVMESYSTSWPNDVDYIPTLEGQPFPVILELDINLKEAYSPKEYSEFDLAAYQTGILSGAFGGSPNTEAKTVSPSGNKVDTSSPNFIDAASAIKGAPKLSEASKLFNGSIATPSLQQIVEDAKNIADSQTSIDKFLKKSIDYTSKTVF